MPLPFLVAAALPFPERRLPLVLCGKLPEIIIIWSLKTCLWKILQIKLKTIPRKLLVSVDIEEASLTFVFPQSVAFFLLSLSLSVVEVAPLEHEFVFPVRKYFWSETIPWWDAFVVYLHTHPLIFLSLLLLELFKGAIWWCNGLTSCRRWWASVSEAWPRSDVTLLHLLFKNIFSSQVHLWT